MKTGIWLMIGLWSAVTFGQTPKHQTAEVSSAVLDTKTYKVILSVKMPDFCDQVASPSVIQDPQNPHLITITPNVIKNHDVCAKPLVERPFILDLPGIIKSQPVVIDRREMYVVRFTGLETVMDILGSQLIKEIQPETNLE